jgi:membrane-associated phospholipid phosphatase
LETRGALVIPGHPDARVSRRVLFLVLLAGYAFFAATYMPINHFSIGREARELFLPGEERLPFLPAFEYLYVTGYFLPIALLMRPPTLRRLRQSIQAFAAVLAVAYTTYLCFPVYFPRPIFEPDSLATWLISVEYLDPSYNHFPSLHVALGVVILLAGGERWGAARWPTTALVIGMSVSTLFVKQHYVADVLYGAALALVAWRWAERRMESRERGRAGEPNVVPLRQAVR